MAIKKTETEEKEKVAPLELNLVGQLGQEYLSLVVAKLNEVIDYINK